MKKRGFTLIELLVVIAIIALLMAILMPSLAKAKKKARRVVCMTNLRSLGQAFHSYAAENDDKVIQYYSFDTATFWSYNIRDYYLNEGILLCPEAIKTIYWSRIVSTYGSPNGITRTEKMGTPNRAWEHMTDNGVNVVRYTGSYGSNGWVHNNINSIPREFSGIDWPSPEQFWGGKMSNGNSEVPLVLDSTSTIGFPLSHRPDDGGEPFTKAEREYWGVDDKEDKLNGAIIEKGEMNCFCFDRHDKLINTVFMDGSTRPVKAEDLWLLRWTRDFPKKTVTIEW